MTVPPSAVARIAPCSQPGTSTQTTVTSAGPPSRRSTAAASADRVAGVGQDDVVGEPGSRSSAGLALRPGRRRRCAGRRPRRAAASDSEPDLPAPPTTATAGGRPASTYSRTTRCGQRRRAADVHDRQRERRGEVVGQDGGDRAAEQDRRARRTGTCSDCGRPSRPARPRSRSGVRVRETSVATWSPDREPEGRLRADLLDGADEHAAGAGHRVLHLAAGRRRSRAPRRGPRRRPRRACRTSWRKRRGVEVEPLDPDPHLVGPQLGPGVEPLGRLRQHSGGLEHAVQADR